MSDLRLSEPRSGLLPEAERALLEGNISRAEKWTKLHLKTSPDDREGRVLLATIYAKSNRIADAKTILTSVIEEGPFYEAHVTLSTIYFYENSISEALEQAEMAIELEPRELAAYNKTGNALVQKGLLELALQYFKRAVEYGPTDVDSIQNLAAALKDSGHMEESLLAWQRVLELDPNRVSGWLNFGMLQLASHDYDSALSAANRAIELEPKSLESWILGGLASSELGSADKAEQFFRQALTLDPNQPLAQASLGVALQEQGKFDDSQKWLLKSVKHWESNGLAYYVLVRSKKVTDLDIPLLETIEKILAKPKIGLLDRSYMEYALGKAFDDLKDYSRSLEHFDRANEFAYEFWFSEKPWDKERYKYTTDRTIETFSPDRIEKLRLAGNASELPILIVGMIRSGTTLVEQILSSHPDIAGAGELTYWHEQASRCFDIQSGEVNQNLLQTTAEGYLRLLKSKGTGAKRVTDKLPHNYAVLGLIHPALPKARIIHIRRNPLDNCFSIYTTGYSRPPGFTLKRDNIVFAYQEYLRMVDHWRQILPKDRFMEIDYEELIANRETLAKQMIEFVGLEWDDRCLSHEKNERVVHTPSAWQVRQPLYTTSIARWKKYEPWLREFAVFADSTQR
jgi:tetratricopeptide (TPR) repeat protein